MCVFKAPCNGARGTCLDIESSAMTGDQNTHSSDICLSGVRGFYTVFRPSFGLNSRGCSRFLSPILDVRKLTIPMREMCKLLHASAKTHLKRCFSTAQVSTDQNHMGSPACKLLSCSKSKPSISTSDHAHLAGHGRMQIFVKRGPRGWNL